MAREPDRPPVPQPEEADDRSDRVGESLRQIFGDAVVEGVPDDMLDLLKKLD
ncbi:MAG: hypothetical protein INF91_05525 [Alphaproteobacteria bacterium]|nr:hypothetical protein [Alphaproteobacteria bacterium]